MTRERRAACILELREALTTMDPAALATAKVQQALHWLAMEHARRERRRKRGLTTCPHCNKLHLMGRSCPVLVAAQQSGLAPSDGA